MLKVCVRVLGVVIYCVWVCGWVGACVSVYVCVCVRVALLCDRTLPNPAQPDQSTPSYTRVPSTDRQTDLFGPCLSRTVAPYYCHLCHCYGMDSYSLHTPAPDTPLPFPPCTLPLCPRPPLPVRLHALPSPHLSCGPSLEARLPCRGAGLPVITRCIGFNIFALQVQNPSVVVAATPLF